MTRSSARSTGNVCQKSSRSSGAGSAAVAGRSIARRPASTWMRRSAPRSARPRCAAGDHIGERGRRLLDITGQRESCAERGERGGIRRWPPAFPLQQRGHRGRRSHRSCSGASTSVSASASDVRKPSALIASPPRSIGGFGACCTAATRAAGLKRARISAGRGTDGDIERRRMGRVGERRIQRLQRGGRDAEQRGLRAQPLQRGDW